MYRAFNLLSYWQRRKPGSRLCLGLFAFWLPILVLTGSLPGRPAWGAGRIILRNTKIYRNPEIERLNVDGVALKGGVVLTWDRIERGQVGDKQADFDRYLKELGNSLYRIRQRLQVGDYRGLLTHAERVYAKYRGRKSDTAYMVCQALMWARVSHGQRETAVEPFLQAFELWRANQNRTIPGRRKLQVDVKTGLTSEILPVWFDPAAAKKALGDVGKTIALMKKPVPDGIRVYYGTLALAAGDSTGGVRALQNIRQPSLLLRQYKQTSLAQHEIMSGKSGSALAAVRSNVESYSSGPKTIAWYWLGLAQLKRPDPVQRQEGLLMLMRIPAIEGRRHPELASAALYSAMKSFLKGKQSAQAAAVRKELLARYGQTFFAMKLKKELSPKRDN